MAGLHFVLVQGAYHTAWHMSFLKGQLERAGYAVSTIDFPSTGEGSAKYADGGGLDADVGAIRDAIEEAAKTADKIVPVFHSYGGICGSEAVGELSETAKAKIHRLVYLAALILLPGKALHQPGRPMAPWSRKTEDGKIHYVPDPISCFYHDVEPGLAKEAAERIVPHAASCFDKETKHGGWRLFPSTYIICKDDRAISVAGQHSWFKGMSEEQRAGWEFEEIEASHSPFLSKPAETARLLRKIVGEAPENLNGRL